MLDQSEENDKKSKLLSKQAILEEIEQLLFLNSKYQLALISTQKDQSSNEAILKKIQEEIFQAKSQVDKQSRQLEHELKCKRNKEEYNHLAESLKHSFEPLQIQNDKLAVITKEIEQMERKYQRQVSEYEKKEKCLRLALSALKCVIDIDEAPEVNNTGLNNGSLYTAQIPLSNGTYNNEPKTSHLSVKNGNANEGSGSIRSREEGEQLEGGEIAY